MSDYPDNSPAKFINNLPVPQELPPDCYVALEEISYVNSIYNIQGNKTSSMTIYDWQKEFPVGDSLNPNPYPVFGEFYNCDLKEGSYQSLEQVCSMLNQALKTFAI